MKTLIFAFLYFIFTVSTVYSQEKRLIRKAAIAVDQSDFEKALMYYDQVLQKDSNSYYGNTGKGVVLSEYIGDFEKAIPYLEKALTHGPQKTKFKINYDLGKSYHHIANYDRALYYYGKASRYNNDKNPDYDIYLTKRIADCKYALNHPETALPSLQWVKNVGSPVNTEQPEYSPVLANGNFIFTSQRRDTKKEKKNGIDGRYFESMYVCQYADGNFSEPERYTLPDNGKDSKFIKHNEAVLSASADGKKLYIFRNAKIYEADLNDPSANAEKMDKNINFSSLQSHACLSPDGKTLYFASETNDGIGGTDLYQAEKLDDGSWTSPKLLTSINTMFHEDAPYMREDGTLFFASNGHPGYGGFDIYKTKFVDGNWTQPENIGQPINSPADDIYFALKPNSSYGYYSSNRNGGKGDMDIYEVHYISSEVPDCKPSDEPLAIYEKSVNHHNELRYRFSLDLPEQFANGDNSFTWKINDEMLSREPEFEHPFNAEGDYTVSVKAVVFCDTCTELLAFCGSKVIRASSPPITDAELAIMEEDNESRETALAEETKTSEIKKPLKKKDFCSNVIERNIGEGKNTALSKEELAALNFNEEPVYYDYDKHELSSDAKKILDENIEILKHNGHLKVTINAYADSRGSKEYNINLSEKRADQVKQYLIRNGIPADRIAAVLAFGECSLFNDCNDETFCSEEEHRENRKVELKLYRHYEIPVTVK